LPIGHSNEPRLKSNEWTCFLLFKAGKGLHFAASIAAMLCLFPLQLQFLTKGFQAQNPAWFFLTFGLKSPFLDQLLLKF